MGATGLSTSSYIMFASCLLFNLIRSEDDSEAPTIHYLKQKGSGRSFAGRFVPQEDARFLTEGPTG